MKPIPFEKPFPRQQDFASPSFLRNQSLQHRPRVNPITWAVIAAGIVVAAALCGWAVSR